MDPALTNLPIRKATPSEEVRFFNQTVRDASTGCLIWVGSRRAPSAAYGCFWFDGTTHQAHRVAWALSGGTIPRGLELDHLCLNPLCVECTHLEVVTAAVNNWRRNGFTWSCAAIPALRRLIQHPSELVSRAEAVKLLGFSCEGAVEHALRNGELRQTDQYRSYVHPEIGRTYRARLIRKSDLALMVLRRGYEDAGLGALRALVEHSEREHSERSA